MNKKMHSLNILTGCFVCLTVFAAAFFRPLCVTAAVSKTEEAASIEVSCADKSVTELSAFLDRGGIAALGISDISGTGFTASVKLTDPETPDKTVSFQNTGDPEEEISSGQSVWIGVWTDAGDQDDLVWTPAEVQADGTAAVRVYTWDHANESGTYVVHAYLKKGENDLVLLDGTSLEVSAVSPDSVIYPENGLAVPALCQQDPAWASLPYWDETYNSAGCGPTAYAMLVSYYEERIATPPEIAELTGMNETNWRMGIRVSHVYGIRMIHASTRTICGARSSGLAKNSDAAKQLKNYIREGYPVVCGVWGSAYGKFIHSKESHVIIVRGITDDNHVLINDPACGSPDCCSDTMTWSEFCRILRYYHIYETKENYLTHA